MGEVEVHNKIIYHLQAALTNKDVYLSLLHKH